jgi:hypothetical protein
VLFHAAVAVLFWRRVRLAHIYQDVDTLWRNTLTKNPQCWMAHNNLAMTLWSSGRVRRTLGGALRIKPDFTQAQNTLARLQARP